MMTRIAVGLLFGALALSPGLALAEEGTHSLEQVVVEMANTPEEHAALARHYHAKAEEARAEMRRHERMGRSYGGGKITQKQRMKRHCQNISEKYSGMAEDYEALAKLHEEEAKNTE
jgi:hypothetical protein